MADVDGNLAACGAERGGERAVVVEEGRTAVNRRTLRAGGEDCERVARDVARRGLGHDLLDERGEDCERARGAFRLEALSDGHQALPVEWVCHRLASGALR